MNVPNSPRLSGAKHAVAALLVLTGQSAMASDIVYTPVNPAFGGNPFNGAHLLAVANAQTTYKDPNATNTTDPSAQFLRTLQSRLLSTLAGQITDVIFGDAASESGLIKFGDQEISYVRGLESVTLTISNAADGSVTEIIVPLLTGGQ